MAIAIPALAGAAAPSGPAISPLLTQVFIAPSGEPFRAVASEAYPVAAWFAGADTDHDGKLSSGEFVIDTERFFKTLDVDHNDRLTRDEIKRYENEIAPEVRSGEYGAIDWNVGGGPRQAGRRPSLGLQDQPRELLGNVPELWSRRKDALVGSGASRYGIIAIPEPVTGMDTDLNGVVTLGEMRASAQRRFKLLDTDDKNYLVLAELPETHVQSRAPKTRKRR